MKKAIVLFFLINGLVLRSIAQDKIVQGIVTTMDSIVLHGATIKVKSTKVELLTDSLGRFMANVYPEDKLIVKAKGFYNQKVKLNENTKLVGVNLQLKLGTRAKEHAIGFGYIDDEKKLNPLSSIDRNEMDFSQYNNILDIIQGRFAGVMVMNGEIIIRGQESFSATNAATVVVNGLIFEGDLNSIPVEEVESINIIKGGSASFYGFRGANGVVVIETR